MTLHSTEQSYQWTFRRVIWATLVLVFIAIGFWLLYRFNQVIFILFVSTVFGTVIRPAATWLYSKGMPRIAGVIFVYLSLVVLIVGFLFLLFPLIMHQSTTIAAVAPTYYQNFHNWMVSSPNQLVLQLSECIPATLPSLVPPVLQPTGSQVMATASQVLEYVTMASQGGFVAIISLILAFYWTLDGPRTTKSFLLLIPSDRREGVGELILAMEAKVSSYVAGQVVLCLVIGGMALIAYLLIGLPNAFVLASIAGVLEAVPMVGPVLGAVPAALAGLSMGPDRLIWVIIATVVIQQLENNFLVPRVMNKAVGVNPFVSLLAFFAFSSLLGMAGALMAIPLAAIMQLLLDRFVFRPSATEAETSTGRDYPSRLRYETQELAQDLRKQVRFQKEASDLLAPQIDPVLDEIETIANDLDALLAQVSNTAGMS